MGDGSNGVDGGILRAFVERIERVEQNISDEQEARKEIYAELKGVGFDPKIVRKIIALRKKSADARREEEELLALYADAIQMDLFN